jgi:uncharacterized protein YerC
MPQISRWPVKKEVYERMFELLVQAVVETSDRSAAIQFLDELLTPVEKIMLAKRLAIVILLIKKYDYQTIQEVIHVSRGTIADMSQCLRVRGTCLRSFANKVMQEEKDREFWGKVGEIITGVGVKGKGSGFWRPIKEEARKNRKKRQAAVI